MELEQRLLKVEEKLAHLERLTEQLNEVLLEQDRRLERLVRTLAGRSGAGAPDGEPV